MLLLLGSCGALAAAGAGGDDAARATLNACGLSHLKGTTAWITDGEQQFRRLLQQAENIHRQMTEVGMELDKHVEQNRVRWSAGARDRSVAPKQLGGVPLVRSKILRQITLRHDMTSAITKLKRLAIAAETEYQQLRKDPEIGFALREVGDKQRLGPAIPYATYLASLPDYEAAVLTDWIPAYLQGSAIRMSGELAEETQATFSWHPQEQRVLIPMSMAKLAGLRIPEDAARQVIRVGDRSVEVRRFTLPYLRFGRCLLRDLPAYLLSPEAEDIGARFGASAFQGYQVTVQRERLRVLIRPIE